MDANAPEVIWVHGRPVSVAGGVFPDHTEPRTLVRFTGPFQEEWRAALTGRGVSIVFWCPPHGACLQLPADLPAGRLPELFPFLAGAAGYVQEHCARGAAPGAGLPDQFVDLVCFGRQRREEVERQLEALGIPVLERSSSKLRIAYRGDLGALRDLVGVKIADPARSAVPLSAAAMAAALGAAAPGGQWIAGIDGRGEIVAVADTGLDSGNDDQSLHPDFRGRIRKIVSWPINSSWAPYVKQPGRDDGASDVSSGHGTHVAGCAVGDGTQSVGRHRGVAPAAQLVFQAIEQYTDTRSEYRRSAPPGYYLNGRPLDLRELFQQARELGARIHINAWGDPARGAYTDDCYEADLFLRDNPDAVVVFAAGNEGADRDADGAIDTGSLYAPASAKNVIAVGATEGPLRGVGQRGTWADLDRNRQLYRASADRSDWISGEPDRVALLSSAGPTSDGRIKPDVCAPGTNIPAPRSRFTQARGWGIADPVPYYMYNGGTSIAAGVAGGVLAALRQAWREHLGGAPSGAALKAILVLGAQPIRGRGTGKQPASRESGGFGRVQIATCLPRWGNTAVRLVEEAGPGLHTGEERLFPFELAKAAPFRAVLAWYDAPGERLVNDLDLSLKLPSGAVIWGNHLPGETGQPDRRNTLELIDPGELPAGAYTLTVTAFNVPEAPQGFALAFTQPAV